MALIDRDEWVKYFESELGIWTHPEALDWAIGKLKDAATIDPIHYAGGCYCRECSYWDAAGDCTCPSNVSLYCDLEGHVYKIYLSKKAGDFCSYGRRKEDADG